MPGIAAIVSPYKTASQGPTVERMVEVMRHESFYRSGTFEDSRCAVTAGWCTHENSFCDCNPIWNEARDVCLLLTGEEFPDPAAQAMLRSRGHRFPDGDASYLVHRYEELGPRFLDELNGTFSGLLVDFRQNLVLLFNDRHGLGRIYLHEAEDGLYLASEAKAILSAVPGTRELDVRGVAEFVSCGCPLQDRTLFKGVFLLPPASLWTFSHGKLLRRETYFRQETWEGLPRLGELEFYERLRETFPAVVRRYFAGSLPVGMSLTGGLDGRMIMASAIHDASTLPCYTFGGTYRDCTDVVLARRVARECGQDHQVVTVGDEFTAQFGRLAEKSVYVSDGAMDVTGSVELFANSKARQIAPVRMTGNYGSEILRGNVAFKAQAAAAGVFSPEFERQVDQARATYSREAGVRRLSFIAMKQVPWYHQARLSVEQSQVTMRSPYLDNEVVRLAYQAPLGQELSKEPALRFVADRRARLAAIPTDRGLLHRPRPVLTHLANAYQEFSFRAEYAYDYGMPNWLARLDQRVKAWSPERLFLGRHKFYHFRVWYRDTLAPYLNDVLLDPRAATRPHLAAGSLRRLVGEHVAGTHNHTTALHQALSIELMHRQLIERKW